MSNFPPTKNSHYTGSCTCSPAGPSLVGSPVSKTVVSAVCVCVCVCCMVHMCVDGGKKGERGWNRFHLLSISNARECVTLDIVYTFAITHTDQPRSCGAWE